jgi:type IX secretion system PorP/SprF family membrane protein
VSFAQDPVFYSSNLTHLYNNPAMSGLNKSFSLDIAYRNQWPNLSGNYVSSVTAVNQYLGKGNGISIQVFTDNSAGTLFKREVDLGYSKTITIGEGHHLTAGVQMAFFQKRIDIDKLTFGDMIDPRTGFVYPGQQFERTVINAVDAHAGLLYYSKFMYASFSTKHLLQPNESFMAGESKLPMLIFGELGGKIEVKDVRFVPYVRHRMQQSFNMTQGGLKVQYKGWFVEGGIQNESTFYAGLGYLGDHVKAGYNLVSYRSFFSSSHSVAHEVFLGMNLNLFKKENANFFDF